MLRLGREFIGALADAGIVPRETTRVVLDVRFDNVAKLYVEAYGNDELLRLVVKETEGSPVIMVKPGTILEEVDLADLP